MTFKRDLIIAGIPAIVALLAITFVVSYETVTVDSSNRREYTYCPISDSDVSKFGGEINGCPVVRIFVSNWNSLTTTQQSTIDTLLRGKGFVDSGEMRLK